MSNLTRKEREIQQRESSILAFARDTVLKEGYHGLNMDKIAEALEYSKGTIYNHFPCKEEILLALGTETMEYRYRLFERAATYQGPPRAQIQAIGIAAELFARLYPDHFCVENMIRLSTIWEKISPIGRQKFQAAEFRCMNLVTQIVRCAIDQGDLELPENFAAEDLVFGLWSLTSGAYSLAQSNPNLANLGVVEPFLSVRVLTNSLADGFHWKPLSHEGHRPRWIAEISEQIFSEELQTLEAAARSIQVATEKG